MKEAGVMIVQLLVIVGAVVGALYLIDYVILPKSTAAANAAARSSV